MNTWLEISKKKLTQNLKLLSQDMPKGLNYFCVIKNNAFGHDSVLMAKEALKNNATYLLVSCLYEALELINNKIKNSIFLLYERFENELEFCIENNFTLQVQSFSMAKKIATISQKQNKITKIHLKVDTGLGRYGVSWKDAAELYEKILQIPTIKLEGIMTHFAQSDELDKNYANLQHERFKQVLDKIDQKKLPQYIHCCNSGGYLDLPHCHYNAVRIGILNTGIYPSKTCRRININGKTLKPIMSLKSKIVTIKNLNPGDKVGYGMHYTATKKTKIAIIPIGYGDGFPRIRNKGTFLINGEFAPIIGGVSMDNTIVNLENIPNPKINDEVCIIGKQGTNEITVHDLGNWGASLCYDQLTNWNQRIKKVII